MDRQRINQIDRNNSNMTIIIALAIVCIVVLGIMIVMFAYIINNKDKKEIVNEPPVLTITECPSVVYADENQSTTVVISGTMMDKNSGCELKINGKSIKKVNKKGETVNWSASFEIPAGITEEYIFELRNNNHVSANETRTVYCHSVKDVPETPAPTSAPQITTPLQAGSKFVKKKSGGLNIRRYAGTYYDVIDFIYATDYSSKMTFTGKYDVDNEGYTWYQIISPSGKYGYVRSDLVKRVS